MQAERHVKLFTNGRNQALRIPQGFDLAGDEVVIRSLPTSSPSGFGTLPGRLRSACPEKES